MDCLVRHYDLETAVAGGYKATWTDQLIYLRSRLTHSEYQFSVRYGSISFSFTRADGVNGARFKMIGYSTPQNWAADIIPMSDAEEDRAFRFACWLADFNPFSPLSSNTSDGLDIIFPPNAIYQGKKHWLYDTTGLLTFGNDTPYGGRENWLFNRLRPCVAGPLGMLEKIGVIKPDPKRAWCSEGVCMLVHAAKQIDNPIEDKLTPAGLHEYLYKAELAVAA